MSGGGADRRIPRTSSREQLASRFHFAEFVPACQTVVEGPMGTIWVQPVQPASELSPEELRVYHENPAPDGGVFDSQDRFLGVVAKAAAR
jgi:hypothetical protein